MPKGCSMLRLGGTYLRVSLAITKSGAKVLRRSKKYVLITGHGFRVPKGCTRLWLKLAYLLVFTRS